MGVSVVKTINAPIVINIARFTLRSEALMEAFFLQIPGTKHNLATVRTKLRFFYLVKFVGYSANQKRVCLGVSRVSRIMSQKNPVPLVP